MGSRARFERERLDRFVEFWEPLFTAFPEAKAKAVKAMGEEMQKDLNAQIYAADLETDAKGTVVSWQELRLGSGGGYAAVSPVKGRTVRSKDRSRSGVKTRQHTYRGSPVSSKQITIWLDKGHGARRPDMTKAYAWSDTRWSRGGKSRVNDRTGTRFVPGRQFYSSARLKATDHAIRAADKVLSMIADEVEY